MSSKAEQLVKFAESQDLSYMQAMVADGTIKDIDEPYNEYGWTAIMYQCLYRNNKGYLERVRFLLGCHPPAKINIQERWSNTCLHMAIYNEYGGGGDDPDLVRLLVENGADRSITNNFGKTALDLAKSNKFDKSVDVLENYFPLLNSNSNSGKNSNNINNGSDNSINIKNNTSSNNSNTSNKNNNNNNNNNNSSSNNSINTSQVSSKTDSFDEEQVKRVCRNPMQPFNHSRIFITGRVGSGKTSLSLSFRGKPPSSRVASTVGVETSVCEIHNAGVDDRGVFVDASTGSGHSESAKAVARAIKRSEKESVQDQNRNISCSSNRNTELKRSGKAVKTVFIDENIDPISSLTPAQDSISRGEKAKAATATSSKAY